MTGYMVKVNFEDGQNVKKGDLLFEIDPRPYQAVLDRVRGELARLYACWKRPKPTSSAARGFVPRAPSVRTNSSNARPHEGPSGVDPRPRRPCATPN